MSATDLYGAARQYLAATQAAMDAAKESRMSDDGRRAMRPDYRREMLGLEQELHSIVDRLGLFLKRHKGDFFMSDDASLAGRWRRVTLVGTDGHMVSGWVPADVADSVNVTITIGAVSYTVVDPFYPSVDAIPGHDRLPRWPDATAGKAEA